MIKKILQPFYAVYVAVTFTISILVAFPFFFIISLGNSIGARRAIYSIIKYWATGWLWLLGMPVRILGNRPPDGRYIVVANHISYLDTLVIFPAIPGYFRALGKKEISSYPIVGYIYKHIAIMVDRSSSHSRSKSLRLLWRVLHKESSIVIFPEGTFNETPDTLKFFYDGAFRLAINTQVPIFPIIMPDTLHRWHYSGWWKFWPGINRAVYLDPIPVAGLTMADLPALKQKVFDAMEAGLRKYPYNAVKQGRE